MSLWKNTRTTSVLYSVSGLANVVNEFLKNSKKSKIFTKSPFLAQFQPFFCWEGAKFLKDVGEMRNFA